MQMHVTLYFVPLKLKKKECDCIYEQVTFPHKKLYGKFSHNKKKFMQAVLMCIGTTPTHLL